MHEAHDDQGDAAKVIVTAVAAVSPETKPPAFEPVTVPKDEVGMALFVWTFPAASSRHNDTPSDCASIALAYAEADGTLIPSPVPWVCQPVDVVPAGSISS